MILVLLLLPFVGIVFLNHHSPTPVPPTFGGSTISTTTVSTLPTTLTCTSGAMGPKFDTPSGFLEAGYYDPNQGPDPTIVPVSATNTVMIPGTSKVAHVVGQQAWTVCIDNIGVVHTYAVSTTTYDSYGKKGAVMPTEKTLKPLYEITAPSTLVL